MRLSRASGYCLYLILPIGVFDYAAYRLYIHRCRGSDSVTRGGYAGMPGVDPLCAKRLGLVWMEKAKKSCFLRFPRPKKAGVMRVGCLGDSFTYGAEVDEGSDFPTLLQKLFDKRGKGKVEVLNFGIGGHGFPQTFIVWKYLARLYDLDDIVLGPGTFYAARADTFSHSQETLPFYIHSRFILEDGKPRLLDIPGRDPEETFENYNSFIPSLNALRYDAQPPAFIKALLPAGRTMKNPFYYYRGTLDEEAKGIYAGLLREMADDGKRIILVHPDKRILDCAAGLRKPNLGTFADPVPPGRPFPYQMPRSHHSPMANQLLAEYLLDILTGKTEGAAAVVEARNIPLKEIPAGPAAGPPKALRDFSAVEITDGTSVIGELSPCPGPEGVARVKSWDFPVQALLGIAVERKGIFDSAFLALDFKLEDGMELTLQRRDGAGGPGAVLGKVRALVPGIFGLVEVPHSDFFWDDDSLGRSAPALYLSFSRLQLPLGEPGEKVGLSLGGRGILEGCLSNSSMISLLAGLKPGKGCALGRFAPSPGDKMDLARARDEGRFSIRFVEGAEKTSIPLSRWSKKTVRWFF